MQLKYVLKNLALTAGLFVGVLGPDVLAQLRSTRVGSPGGPVSQNPPTKRQTPQIQGLPSQIQGQPRSTRVGSPGGPVGQNTQNQGPSRGTASSGVGSMMDKGVVGTPFQCNVAALNCASCTNGTTGPCGTIPTCDCPDGLAILRCEDVRPPATPPWDFTLQLPAFDPALGELKKVDVLGRLDVSVVFRAENMAPDNNCNPSLPPPAGDVWSWDAGGVGTIHFGGNAGDPNFLQIAQSVVGPTNFCLDAFDGMNDAMGHNICFPTGASPYPNCPVGGEFPVERCIANMCCGSGFTSPVTMACACERTCFDENSVGDLTLDDFIAAFPNQTLPFFTEAVATNNFTSTCGSIDAGFTVQVGVTMQVTYSYCPNERPVVLPDDAETCQTDKVMIDVLNNDFDPDGTLDATSVTIVTGANSGLCDECNPGVGCVGPQLGTVIVNPVTGVIEYCPNFGAIGIDRFRYFVLDNEGCRSPCALVTVEIFDAPTANPDMATTCPGQVVDINVTNNDNGPLDPCSVEICFMEGPSMGTAVPLGQPNCGIIRYMPFNNAVGVDTFMYRVAAPTTGQGAECLSNCTTVTVTILAPPVANPDTAMLCERKVEADPCVFINVLANDAAPGGIDPTSVVLCTNPALGDVTINPATGLIEYCPDLNRSGFDSFTYRYRDNNGCFSNCASVQVEIKPGPTLVDDIFFKDPEDASPIPIPVLDNDPGPNIDPTTVMVTVPAANGNTAVNPVTGVITYTPGVLFPGMDMFFYKALDTNGCYCEAKVTVTEDICVDFNRRMPASLLLFPEYDNRNGCLTVFSFTNTKFTGPNVRFETVYREESACTGTSRFNTLTPNETLTICTTDHMPINTRGYAYSYVVDGANNPIVQNSMIGQVWIMEGVLPTTYSVNAVSFKGVGEKGDLTDMDGDGIRDLDNIEYEPAPDRIFIPRFLGQSTTLNSELILIGLSGGVAFSTQVQFLIYNDNEDQFSRTRTFTCWERIPLLSISSAFGNTFLHDFSDDDPNEILGMEEQESGWIYIDGIVAQSFAKTILDPAVYAVLVEMNTVDMGTYNVLTAAADLPWEFCDQDNGSLLPKSLFGDNSD